MAATNRPKSKSLYLIAAASWKSLDSDSFERQLRRNSNMDTLQLLTRSLRARCAFSALTLLVPRLLPPGSCAILLMAEPPLPKNTRDASQDVGSLLFILTLKGH